MKKVSRKKPKRTHTMGNAVGRVAVTDGKTFRLYRHSPKKDETMPRGSYEGNTKRKPQHPETYLGHWPTRAARKRGSGGKQFNRLDVRLLGYKVVAVNDLPLTRRESSYDSIVRKVHSLPKGKGICLRPKAPKPDAEGKSSAIKAWANKIGKPVTTQIRSAGGADRDGNGYQIWIFKRRDFIVKRNGHASRL